MMGTDAVDGIEDFDEGESDTVEQDTDKQDRIRRLRETERREDKQSIRERLERDMEEFKKRGCNPQIVMPGVTNWIHRGREQLRAYNKNYLSS